MMPARSSGSLHPQQSDESGPGAIHCPPGRSATMPDRRQMNALKTTPPTSVRPHRSRGSARESAHHDIARRSRAFALRSALRPLQTKPARMFVDVWLAFSEGAQVLPAIHRAAADPRTLSLCWQRMASPSISLELPSTSKSARCKRSANSLFAHGHGTDHRAGL